MIEQSLNELDKMNVSDEKYEAKYNILLKNISQMSSQ